MDDTVNVMGFNVRIAQDGDSGGYTMSVDELPGCIGQVGKRGEIVPEMARLIRAHLLELARKRPAGRKTQEKHGPAHHPQHTAHGKR
jgi:predicted RNase H-like HicB family nuclease